MNKLNVYDEILSALKYKKLHMTLIDPAAQPVSRSVEIAEKSDRAGTDFFLIGGSTGITSSLMDKTINEIKKKTDKRIIIFPGSSAMVSRYADAIYYMVLMNSNNIEYVMGHHVKSSILLKSMGIETIPMGYLIFEPGMTVGKVGNAKLIRRDDEVTALSYALAAEFFGYKMLYLESGSGSPTYISENVIKRLKKEIKIPLIVGGGIRTCETARKIIDAGADVIVTGTLLEKSNNVYTDLKNIINAI